MRKDQAMAGRRQDFVHGNREFVAGLFQGLADCGHHPWRDAEAGCSASSAFVAEQATVTEEASRKN
jgi:hypothetical protein